MTKRKLVTFLSAPFERKDAAFEFEGEPGRVGPFSDASIIEIWSRRGTPFTEATLYATDEAEKVWNAYGEQAWKEAGGPPATLVRAILPKVREDFWTAFQGLASELEAPVDEIVLNVTHGFRSQPLVALAALAFVESSTLRMHGSRGAAPPIRILYGELGTRELWELSDLVAVTQWNRALDAFLRYGRADELDAQCTRDARGQSREGTALRELGRKARLFADDLALGRFAALITKGGSAEALYKHLASDDLRRWTSRLPVLGPDVAALRELLAADYPDDAYSGEAHSITLRFAALYGRLQRFAEQSAVLRELGITAFGVATGRRSLPGGANRAAAEQELSSATTSWRDARKKAKAPPSLSRRLAALLPTADAAHARRNDLLHLGIRDNPEKASRMRTALDELVLSFEEALAPAESDRFLNLSNHPIAQWSDSQVAAAQALGLGKLEDLRGPMPEVPPEATTVDVSDMARTLADSAIEQGAVGAFVAGDFTLTTALVADLQTRGVRCFSATGKRVSSEERLDEGTTRRNIHFRFVRFREYPRIAADA